MYKIKISIILILLLLIFQNCSDEFLQEKLDRNKFSYDIFENETQTNDYLANIYYNFYNNYDSPIKSVYGAPSDENTKMTEEIGGTIGDYIDSTMTLITSEDGDTYYGSRLPSGSPANEPYSRIRDCNTLIENVEKYGEGKLNDDFITYIKGQAYFLRGLQYFELMRKYGGVPLVTKVQDAVLTDESIKLPRASVEEVLEQIAADFDEAAKMLPIEWVDAAADYGRPTKGAALAMKSRILLTGASPLFNRDWDNESNQRWADALAAGLEAKSELETAGYGLYGSSANDWAEMFYDFDNVMCPEAIHVILCSQSTESALNSGWEGEIRLPSQGGDGIAAPKQMIDLFPMADGSRPTADNGYDEFLFFQNRDPRFYRTFGFSGMQWSHSDASTPVWAYTWTETDFGVTNYYYSFNNEINSYAFVTKMSDLTIDSTDYTYSGADIFEYRFAELLLNIAECYAAQGDIDKCIEYLGKIRERVGIPAANNYGIGNLANKYEALEACLYERRVELAYEGKRFYDIQRWMLYNDDPAADNNTCEKLGLEPLNGTARTGMYLNVKDSNAFENPLLNVLNISYDPAADNLQEQLDELADFYSTYFELAELEYAMDQLYGTPTVIDWKQYYYIHGIHTTVLEINPWIEQTVGWENNFGEPGTYEYR